MNTKMYAPQLFGLGEGFISSIRSGTSFTSRPVEVADSHGEARTLAGVVYSSQYCLLPVKIHLCYPALAACNMRT